MLSDSIWKDILKLQRQTFSVFTVSKMHILKTILIAWVTVLDLYMVHSDVIWNDISELQREMKSCLTQEYCKFRHYKVCIKLILTLFETYGWRHLCSPVPLYPRTPFFSFFPHSWKVLSELRHAQITLVELTFDLIYNIIPDLSLKSPLFSKQIQYRYTDIQKKTSEECYTCFIPQRSHFSCSS